MDIAGNPQPPAPNEPQPRPDQQQAQPPQQGQPSSYSQPQSTSSTSDYVTRNEFEDRVGKLEKSRDDQLTVSAPQPDPEVTAATAAAVGQPDPNIYGDDNHPPEGAPDPIGRSDGSGLGTEGNDPVPAEHAGILNRNLW